MTPHTFLPLHAWQSMAADHQSRARRWTQPAKKRRDCGELHPIEDFIFDYYPFSFRFIESWHPGCGVAIEWPDAHAPRPPHWQTHHYRWHEGWLFADPNTLTPAEIRRIQWTIDLLDATHARTPNFACHGLHEWAMVYQGLDVRHEKSLKLRLPQNEIDAIVETQPIRCTHFDAFRFFAPTAKPYNPCQPTLETRCANENPACLHANMDLFKWSAKTIPWASSHTLLQSFELAHALRLLDMQASAYDLSPWNLPPVEVNTATGRKLYESMQRAFYHQAQPLRAELSQSLKATLQSLASPELSASFPATSPLSSPQQNVIR